MTGSQYTRDGHRLVARIEVVESTMSHEWFWSDLRIEIECPGEGRCGCWEGEAPAPGGDRCKLREWADAEGIEDFVECYLEKVSPLRADLPVEIEYYWRGDEEDAEPRFRPVTQ